MASVTREPYAFIRAFVRHPTASNLIMLMMILMGGYSLVKLNTQFFPTIEIPVITVSVSWPGASAEDVEKNIIDAIEPEIRFLDGVEDITALAREGVASFSLEYAANADMQKAQSDVEQAVARITTLPEDSEDPRISRVPFRDRVANISISGPFPEATIKRYAKDIRDGLLNAGIDKVTMTGARSEEIHVVIPERDLRRLNLSLSDVSQRIRDNIRDIPSGTVEGEVDVQIRSLSDRKTAEQIGAIEVKSNRAGEKTYLREIATVSERFDDDEKLGLNKSRTAIQLVVQRALSADTIKSKRIVEDYVAEARKRLPPTLEINLYNVRGKFVQQRLGILLNNGLQGLVIVLVVLFIFLDFRIAFWTAVGIPVAFMATLAVMYASGQTINMISMFALIMMLGIIVDDAIVVGEHTSTLRQRGMSRQAAAELGGSKMLKPVLAATLTTQAAFFPILLVSGRLGDIMSAIPLVVIAVLFASVLECFLILPGHLSHGHGKPVRKPGLFRRKFDAGLTWFRDGSYRRFVTFTYEWRYVTVTSIVVTFMLALGLLGGKHVKFRFFPSPEAEIIRAYIEFGAGTPRREQRAAVARVAESLDTLEERLLKQVASTSAAGMNVLLVETTFTTLGKSGRTSGDNLAQIEVQLAPSEVRTIRTGAITKAWRRTLPKIPGVERISIVESRGGPPGRDVDVRLQNAPVATLKLAAEELKQALTGFAGVRGIADDLPWGKQELQIELTPRGRSLGLTGQMIGSQVRNAFEGAIATRFARGDEEITVRVSQQQRESGRRALEAIYVRGADGTRVPLSEVVRIKETRGFSLIQRRDGLRTVSVTADIAPDAEINTPDLVAQLDKEVMPAIAAKYGIDYTYKGKEEERSESFADLKLGALLALAMIYIILAWVFESYAKPLAVMAIIPFGFVGAVVGHYVMGLPLTIISILGLLGLSGILVNDSIILMTQVSERLEDGERLHDAAIGASQDRLRAVLLTSLTTIGGLLPLLFETSRQAQFLIPMAATMVFGLAAATILVLILIPSLVGIGGDIGQAVSGVWRTAFPRPEPVA